MSEITLSFFKRLSLERIVFLITILVVVLFAVTLDTFLTKGNIIALIQGVSIIGILGIGMSIVVISRGIDLSMIAIMTVSSAWTFELMKHGSNVFFALMCGFVLALAIGFLNGFFIAYLEVPALFTTIASTLFLYGFGRSFLIEFQIANLPVGGIWLECIGKGKIFDIPVPILIFLAMVIIFSIFQRLTRQGLINYAVGDSPLAARLTGIKVRIATIWHYLISALIAWITGIVLGTYLSMVSLEVVSSQMIYDVILVVVLGGVSLSGGKGKVWNIFVATILVGTLVNGMIIMNFPYHIQSIIRGVILLIAITLDSMIHPIDEETVQQGDI